MAGASSPQLQTEAEMIKAICEARRIPIQRNTFYEPLKCSDGAEGGLSGETAGPSKLLESNLATA
jgi:hypothetical protein